MGTEDQEDTEGGTGGIRAIKTVASGGALKFGGRIVTLALGLVVQIVMARLLVPDSYGSVTLAIAVLSISLRFGTLGVDSGVSRLYPVHEDEPSKARGVVRALFRLSLVSGLAIAVVLFLAAPVLANQVFDEPKLVPLLRVIAIGIPFAVAGENSIALARAARDARPRVFIYDILRPILRLGFIAALIYAGFEAVGAVAGHMLAMVLAGIVAIVVVMYLLPSWDAPAERMDRELLTYSVPLLFASGISYLMSEIDTFMVGYFLASEKVGTYNISYQLGTFAIFFLTAGGYILPPMLARLQTEGRTTEMDELYRTITKWIAFASVPVVVVLLAYPGEFIGLLFGTEYLEGTNVLRVLVLGTFASILVGTAGSSLTSLGNNRIVLYTVTSAAILNVVLNVTLIPMFGILGAGLATMTSTATLALFQAAVLFRFHRLLPLGRLGMRTVGVSGIVAGLLYAVSVLSVLPTVAAGVLWALVHGLVIVLIGVNERDKRIFVLVEDRLGVRIPFVRRIIRLQN